MNRTKRRPSVEFLETRQALSSYSGIPIFVDIGAAPAAKIPPAPVAVYQTASSTGPNEVLELN